MGIFTEYLESNFSFDELNQERKKQLNRISEIRGNRDILVYAADYNKSKAPISISYEDLLAVSDQCSNLNGNRLDLILETPGGSGEVAEDIVNLLRQKYEDIAVIIPGWAKSAGTIIAMSSNDILMEPASALGPIDAQITRDGKTFSADALITGMKEIKQEVERTGNLNKAYIPILQGISPGEIQGAQNALDFAKVLVREWLVVYKFKDWNTHSSTGIPVTQDEKFARAEEIATKLCDHNKWLTHGRSIKIKDLEEMKLKITDYSKDPQLADAIRRYYTLLKMTLDTNIYKVYETKNSQIFKSINHGGEPPRQPHPTDDPTTASFEIQCPNCHHIYRIQANLEHDMKIQPGHVPFPKDNIFECLNCGRKTDLSDARKEIMQQTGKVVV